LAPKVKLLLNLPSNQAPVDNAVKRGTLGMVTIRGVKNGYKWGIASISKWGTFRGTFRVSKNRVKKGSKKGVF
jgi:hypothetical protein